MKLVNKKLRAMSAMGYVIALIIFIGVGMIISAPFIADSQKENHENNAPAVDNIVIPDFTEIENKINKKLSVLESRIDEIQNNSSDMNKYVCSIEGKLDNNGNVIPIENASKNSKFVFVCEYK